MKRHVWTVMPVYLIFAVLMLVMAGVTYYYNPILSIVEGAVALAALAVVLVMMITFRRYIKNIVTGALDSVYLVSEDYLEKVKLPTAVCGARGEILMCNTRFEKAFFGGKSPIGESIYPCIDDHDLTYALNAETLDVTYGQKKFSVFTRAVEGGVFFSFVENTYYKNIVEEYLSTKKSVALMMFDNMEDFSSDSIPDAASAQVKAESVLYGWANEKKAIMRKLADSRYLAIFDERDLKKEVEEKFRILDRVREISYNGRAVTVSMGIGRGCDDLTTSAANAKKALEMAQGRGGDQVALLFDGDYEFFGGVKKGIERTSKVRVRVISEAIASAVSGAEKILVMGHRYSDLDCIGAACGLACVIKKKFKKQCAIVVDEEHSMAKAMIEHMKTRDERLFISPERGAEVASERTLLIIVDTHSPDFIESKDVKAKCGSVIVIDHHRRMVNAIADASVFLHEPSASSASELVTELVEYLGDDVIGREEAEALLSGIMLDTKNFIVNTGVRTFEAAAYLRKKGADTVTVRDAFSNSLENYREKSKLVSGARIVNHCAIAVARDVENSSRLVCAQAADDLLSIRDTYASFVISMIDENTVNISARSFGKLNVQLVMEKLGGGGHQTMAAVQLSGVSLDEAKDRLTAVLEEMSFSD